VEKKKRNWGNVNIRRSGGGEKKEGWVEEGRPDGPIIKATGSSPDYGFLSRREKRGKTSDSFMEEKGRKKKN